MERKFEKWIFDENLILSIEVATKLISLALFLHLPRPAYSPASFEAAPASSLHIFFIATEQPIFSRLPPSYQFSEKQSKRNYRQLWKISILNKSTENWMLTKGDQKLSNLGSREGSRTNSNAFRVSMTTAAKARSGPWAQTTALFNSKT